MDERVKKKTKYIRLLKLEVAGVIEVFSIVRFTILILQCVGDCSVLILRWRSMVMKFRPLELWYLIHIPV
jgi:hypothetical protein